MTKEDILQSLRAVKYPPYQKDIVAFGMVKYVKADGDSAEVRIFTGGDGTIARNIIKEASEVLHKDFPGKRFEVILLESNPSNQPPAKDPKENALPGVKLKVAIASGKGGVGKSTVAVNLARSFAKIFSKGSARVGLMDCDIHGPSASILMRERVFPSVSPDDRIIPPEIGGIKVMSMGMLVSDDQPLLWRGPMVTSAIKQFTEDMIWGELDAMVIDLPPGTGDAVLSAVQLIPLDGAIIVTTPNSLASTTATRGAMVFQKSDVKIFGVVENMAYFQMPDGSKEYIFGDASENTTASALDSEIIAQIPIDKTLHSQDVSENSRKIFDALAQAILEKAK